jgi:hypothetical protein
MTATTLTFTFDHVGIDVEDMDAQTRFYTRAFDLKREVCSTS